MSSFIILISIPFQLLPTITYLLDGYYEKNIKRGFKKIVAFIFFCLIGLILIKSFGIYFVYSFPLLMIGYILFLKSRY